MKNLRGQTIMEYAVLIIIIMAVFLSMSNYVKRGIQGRWKAAVDDVGEQYDPRLVNSRMTSVIESNSDTAITTVPSAGGYYTNRVDTSRSVEVKDGYISVGSCTQGNCTR